MHRHLPTCQSPKKHLLLFLAIGSTKSKKSDQPLLPFGSVAWQTGEWPRHQCYRASTSCFAAPIMPCSVSGTMLPTLVAARALAPPSCSFSQGCSSASWTVMRWWASLQCAMPLFETALGCDKFSTTGMLQNHVHVHVVAWNVGSGNPSLHAWACTPGKAPLPARAAPFKQTREEVEAQRGQLQPGGALNGDGGHLHSHPHLLHRLALRLLIRRPARRHPHPSGAHPGGPGGLLDKGRQARVRMSVLPSAEHYTSESSAAPLRGRGCRWDPPEGEALGHELVHHDPAAPHVSWQAVVFGIDFGCHEHRRASPPRQGSREHRLAATWTCSNAVSQLALRHAAPAVCLSRGLCHWCRATWGTSRS